MRITMDGAKEKLVYMLERFATGKQPMQCIQIKCDILKERDLEELPAFINAWTGNPEGDIVVCMETRHIFVFSAQLNEKVFTRFNDIFYAHLVYHPQVAADFVSYFGPGADWNALLKTIQDKRSTEE